jgi:hypothetical protein
MRYVEDFKNFSLNETSKYKSITGINFIKLYTKICNHYKIESDEITYDFKQKLFQYLSKEESKKFPINFFSYEYKSLVDLIHVLDNKNAEILIHISTKKQINIGLPDLKPVWTDEKNKIYVYRANNAFESILLGKGTNFCISADPKNGKNWFYDYIYKENLYGDLRKVSSIYFIKSLNGNNFYKTIALDVINEDGGYIYTDIRNKDMKYSSYEDMIVDDYTSPDLKIIPQDIFKPFDHILTKAEFLSFPFLIKLVNEVSKKEKDEIFDKINKKNINVELIRDRWIYSVDIRKSFGGYLSVLVFGGNFKPMAGVKGVRQEISIFCNTLEEIINYIELQLLMYISERILIYGNDKYIRGSFDDFYKNMELSLNKNKKILSPKIIKHIKETYIPIKYRTYNF